MRWMLEGVSAKLGRSSYSPPWGCPQRRCLAHTSPQALTMPTPPTCGRPAKEPFDSFLVPFQMKASLTA